MCLDFHPVHASLLAVGCHDGTVMVFDVRHKANRPIYSSSIKTGRHTDPVWQVRAIWPWRCSSQGARTNPPRPDLIQSNPIRSNLIRLDPIQPNPIQFDLI